MVAKVFDEMITFQVTSAYGGIIFGWFRVEKRKSFGGRVGESANIDFNEILGYDEESFGYD